MIFYRRILLAFALALPGAAPALMAGDHDPSPYPASNYSDLYTLFVPHVFKKSGGSFIPPLGLGKQGYVQARDFDGDGDLDFVVLANWDYVVSGVSNPSPNWVNGSDLAWFENVDGRGNFLMRSLVNEDGSHIEIYDARYFDLADVDGDGDLDVTLGSNSGTPPASCPIPGVNRLMWLENLAAAPTSNAGKVRSHIITHFPFTRRTHWADMDGDGLLDIVAAGYLNYFFSGIDVWPHGPGTDPSAWFTGPPPGNVKQSGTSSPLSVTTIADMLVVNDLNGDGFKDMVFGHMYPGTSNEQLSVVLTAASSSTYQETIIASNFAAVAIGVSDFNRDGLMDIVAGGRTNAGDPHPGIMSIFLQTPGSLGLGWTRVQMPGADTFTRDQINAVEVADFNNDGWPDVSAVCGAGFTSPHDMALAPKRMFAHIAVWLNPGLAVDGNSDTNVSVAEMAAGPAKWFMIPVPDSMPAGTTFSGIGTLSSGDFDGDGDIDFVRVGGSLDTTWFENVMDTKRRVELKATVNKGDKTGTVTSVLSVTENKRILGTAGEKAQ